MFCLQFLYISYVCKLNYIIPWQIMCLSVLLMRCRVEKYRPKTLGELISHKDIINTSKWMLFSIITYY